MVMVFCITWWLVTFEASQKADQAEQTFHQADQAREAAKQAEPEAQRAYMPQAPDQAREEVKQAGQKAKPLVRRTLASLGSNAFEQRLSFARKHDDDGDVSCGRLFGILLLLYFGNSFLWGKDKDKDKE